ncbi:MAG TPA: hypothetical protein VFE05_21915 [Longimicrobiaceae bacterium]|nr:hypothetical protein [Longimicrobiaceae bacterium]
MTGASTTLWTDDVAKRFYLVPEDVSLGEGPLALRAGAFRRVAADPAAVAPYEVPKDEARAFLDRGFGEFVTGARDSLIATLGLTPFPKLDEPEESEGPGPGVRLFADLAGEPPERIAEDPQAFVDAFARMMRGAGDKLSRALRSEGGKDELRAAMSDLAATLKKHGISADPAGAPTSASAESPKSSEAPAPADVAAPPTTPVANVHQDEHPHLSALDAPIAEGTSMPGSGAVDDRLPASPELEAFVAELERAVRSRGGGN